MTLAVFERLARSAVGFVLLAGLSLSARAHIPPAPPFQATRAVTSDPGGPLTGVSVTPSANATPPETATTQPAIAVETNLRAMPAPLATSRPDRP